MNYLNSGIVDIAFATTNERDEHFESYMCFKTHTAFVAAPDYDIDFDRTYTLKEISKLPLILLEKEAGSRRFLEDCFLKHGLRLEPEIELASYELLISLAGIGLGVAGITEEFSQAALKAGSVKKLKLSENQSPEDIFMNSIDTTEGAGLGIIMITKILRQLSTAKDCFSIRATDTETITELKITKA